LTDHPVVPWWQSLRSGCSGSRSDSRTGRHCGCLDNDLSAEVQRRTRRAPVGRREAIDC